MTFNFVLIAVQELIWWLMGGHLVEEAEML